MLQEKFSYSSQPHAAPGPKRKQQKYRDDPSQDGSSLNMMNDPRVVRGSTYAAKVMTTNMQREQENQIQQNNRRVLSEQTQRRKQQVQRATTPPPVDGRCHMVIQTEEFLEELSDKAVEVDAETQTQPFMDRPMSPLFVRSKTGTDMTTQIEHGDLFDFDLEVAPILDVLVGKTIHVSMLELMQAEELEAIRRDQEEFEAIRNLELAEVQRLEAEARRKAEEKDRRIAQEKQVVLDKAALEDKIAARAFSNQYLASVHVNVMDELYQEGFFFNPVKKEIESEFYVDVMSERLMNTVNSYAEAESMLEELLQDAVKQCKDVQAKAVAARKIRQEKEAEEAAIAAKLLEEENARIKAEAEAAAAAEED